jgi:D-lactate dehydrogenase
MKTNVMLINTSRGPVIDTNAVLKGVQNNKIGYLGLDVYEYEQNLYFYDHSQDRIQDKLFMQLRALPNVLLTAHQAFFTREAVTNIAKYTINNLVCFFMGDLESGNNILV